jgi:hypothetical protein
MLEVIALVLILLIVRSHFAAVVTMPSCPTPAAGRIGAAVVPLEVSPTRAVGSLQELRDRGRPGIARPRSARGLRLKSLLFLFCGHSGENRIRAPLALA